MPAVEAVTIVAVTIVAVTIVIVVVVVVVVAWRIAAAACVVVSVLVVSILTVAVRIVRTVVGVVVAWIIATGACVVVILTVRIVGARVATSTDVRIAWWARVVLCKDWAAACCGYRYGKKDSQGEYCGITCLQTFTYPPFGTTHCSYRTRNYAM
ncbi:MAG TPA: hypothetical protein VE862_08935 [Candidatus Acidoferrum sp.]|nr:hypothetical protein [Candidatus Acidoferrum sp.]